MKARICLVAILLVSCPALFAEDALKGESKRLLDSSWRMAKARRFSASQEKRLRKMCAEVGAEELGQVIDALLVKEAPGKSFAAVLAVLDGIHLRGLYGEEPLKALPDLAVQLRSDDPSERVGLISSSLFFDDQRLAKHLALAGTKSESSEVRYRAARALADLLNFGVREGEYSKALVDLLSDEASAVRIASCQRAFEAGLDPVFEWAVEHLGDNAKTKIMVRGKEVVTCPGATALAELQELTWVQRELTYEEFRRLSDGRRKSFLALLRAWWVEVGETFPAPGFREAKFRAKPSSTKSVVVGSGLTTASVNFWAGLDRTRIRVALDELECTASDLGEFDVNFHLRYMAQGMRTDDGEAYRRHFPVGEKYLLARKAIGCFVIVFQMLTEDRLKIHVRFYDPLL